MPDHIITHHISPYHAVQGTPEELQALAASQPADPVTNAGCRQPVKVKPVQVKPLEPIPVTLAEAVKVPEVRAMVEALRDLTKAFAIKVDVKQIRWEMPYEHPLSAYDRAVSVLAAWKEATK